MKKSEKSLYELQDNIKGANICIMESHKEMRERKGQEVYLKK